MRASNRDRAAEARWQRRDAAARDAKYDSMYRSEGTPFVWTYRYPTSQARAAAKEANEARQILERIDV